MARHLCWHVGHQPRRPAGTKLIPARSHRVLTAGAHPFGLHWRIPGSQPSGTSYLVSAHSSHRRSPGIVV